MLNSKRNQTKGKYDEETRNFFLIKIMFFRTSNKTLTKDILCRF